MSLLLSQVGAPAAPDLIFPPQWAEELESELEEQNLVVLVDEPQVVLAPAVDTAEISALEEADEPWIPQVAVEDLALAVPVVDEEGVEEADAGDVVQQLFDAAPPAANDFVVSTQDPDADAGGEEDLDGDVAAQGSGPFEDAPAAPAGGQDEYIIRARRRGRRR